MHWPLRCTSAPTMVAKKKTSTRKTNSKRTIKSPKPVAPRMAVAKAKKAVKKVARKIAKK